MESVAVRGAVLAIGGLLICGAALAHDRTHSYSTWKFEGSKVEVLVRLAELDTTHFAWGLYPPAERDRELSQYLRERMLVSIDGQPCAAESLPRNLRPGAGRLAFSWTFECPPGRTVRIRSDMMFEVAPTHLHFVRVEGLTPTPLEKVFTAAQREWTIEEDNGPPAREAPTGFLGYLTLGLEHIATGYDHLAFVVALVLLGGSLASLAKVVTAFTVAHSVTLACSVLGWLKPDAQAVEALIGFSIAMVAVENLWLRSQRCWRGPWFFVGGAAVVTVLAATGRGNVPFPVSAGTALFAASFFAWAQSGPPADSWRWVVAFLFGLVHGFGFATVLLEVGLPPMALAMALGGFNLGVELGQLAVVGITWPLLRWLMGARPALGAWVVDVASAIVLGLGTYWFFVRAYG